MESNKRVGNDNNEMNCGDEHYTVRSEISLPKPQNNINCLCQRGERNTSRFRREEGKREKKLCEVP